MAGKKVIAKLVDHGSEITSDELKLKGHESVEVEESEFIINLRKNGVIKTEPIPELVSENKETKTTKKPS